MTTLRLLAQLAWRTLRLFAREPFGMLEVVWLRLTGDDERAAARLRELERRHPSGGS